MSLLNRAESIRIASAVALVSGVVFAAAFTSCDLNDGPCGTGAVCAPDMHVAPNPVIFDALAVGESQTEIVFVVNTSGRALTIDTITLVDESGEYGLADTPQLPTVIGAGDPPLVVPVTYTRGAQRHESAHLLITSDSRSTDYVRVELTPATELPDIVCTPQLVAFERITPAAANEASGGRIHSVTCTNTGEAPLRITDFSVLGSDHFRIADSAPDASFPLILAPLEELAIGIEFEPESGGLEEGALVILSNDGDQPRKEIPLVANRTAEPCLAVTHAEGFAFPDTRIGSTTSETFEISSCASGTDAQSLVVSGVSLINTPELSSSDAFSVIAGDLFADGDLTLAPGETASFAVNYAPTAEGIDDALLEIRSNDTLVSPRVIPLSGVGRSNICPTAVATCRVAGGLVDSDQLTAPPLSTLECSGTSSSAPGGFIADWEWSILTRPEGSTAQLQPNGGSATPSFFLDMVGIYEMQLEVTDDVGNRSCNPAVVTVVVTPDEVIHVQLTWETPGLLGPQESAGADLDLHFLNPVGKWRDSPWDVYYLNKTPTWNDVSHPRMDIDDVNGTGPEIVNLDDPEDDTWYRVGVHYYSTPTGLSEPAFTYATVRLYVNGILTFEIAGKELAKSGAGGSCQGEFWDVAAVHWPTGNISNIDTVYDNMNDSIPGSCPETP